MTTPPANRLGSLPLILAGPMLRRVDDAGVTVWLALKEASAVTLRVYTWTTGPTQQLIGTAHTVPIGAHLHVVAVTATPEASDQLLTWGEQYVYNLFFAERSLPEGAHLPESDDNLNTPGILNLNPTTATRVERLVYPNNALPSFAMAPPNLNSVRIVHASCRKPHGEGDDALVTVDQMIESTASDPSKRPHLLFLTGDQIYADDVADALLAVLDDAGQALLGWQEPIPEVNDTNQLKPGHRAIAIERTAGFTGGLSDPALAKSHLLRFGDYCAMYLAVWADVIWPPRVDQMGRQVTDWPTFRAIYPDTPEETFATVLTARESFVLPPKVPTKEKQLYLKEATALEDFRSTLPQVRRALANIPTYMIFDDHEITDDWYINLKWCERVLQRNLGRRILRNGLAAYALFQSWGNTPERFQANQPGQALLEALTSWSQQKGNDQTHSQTISQRVGLPHWTDVKASNRLDKVAGSLDWHYHVYGPSYEVLVMNSRTRREFPGGPYGNPVLINRAAMAEQILNPPHKATTVTIVIAPAPVLGVPLLEWYQSVRFRDTAAFKDDAEAWGLQTVGFELLLGRFALRVAAAGQTSGQTNKRRIVLLSGDVHYGFSARMQYWSTRPFEGGQPHNVEMIITQLTASSLKNQTALTNILHTKGYSLRWDFLPQPVERLGWNNAGQRSIEVGTVKINPQNFIEPIPATAVPWRVTGYPARTDLATIRNQYVDAQLTTPPHWQYRFDYLLGENDVERPASSAPRTVPAPPTGDRKLALASYLAMARNHKDYLGEWGDGKEIVGVNNLGEISFRVNSEDDWTIVHELWWRLRGRRQTLTPFPLTRYLLSLRYNDPRYPKPDIS